MKIIAQVSSNTLLVEMTARELANIAGKNYESDLEARSGPYSRATGLEVGTEYEVSPAWQRLKEQERAADRLNQAADSLRALSDLTRSLLPTVVLVTGKELKEERGTT